MGINLRCWPGGCQVRVASRAGTKSLTASAGTREGREERTGHAESAQSHAPSYLSGKEGGDGRRAEYEDCVPSEYDDGRSGELELLGDDAEAEGGEQ
jgi:hypothetical protein